MTGSAPEAHGHNTTTGPNWPAPIEPISYDEGVMAALEAKLATVPQITYSWVPQPKREEEVGIDYYNVYDATTGDLVGDFATELAQGGTVVQLRFPTTHVKEKGYGWSIHLTLMRDLAKIGVPMISGRGRITRSGLDMWLKLSGALAVKPGHQGPARALAEHIGEDSYDDAQFRTTLFSPETYRRLSQPRNPPKVGRLLALLTERNGGKTRRS